ncbi:MAG: hypothetical protein NXI24_13640 [bacterium]|nr:hypothetical protein [bacterium]
MKIAGILIIAFGLVDLIGSFVGFDLWGGFLGIDLPELVWKFSSYAELTIGYLLFKFGSAEPEESEE